MGKDWYPRRENEIPEWHTAFATNCQATGTTLGLSAADVNQSRVDQILANLSVDFDLQVETFAQAWQAWKKEVLYGDPNAAFSAPPISPNLSLPDEDFRPGIRKRTRRMANIIKSDSDYTQAVGEQFGIATPSAGVLATPQIKNATPVGNFAVKLRVLKAGSRVVVIDMRRGGGTWTQIGVAQTAFFIDRTPPEVAGVPEQREYRAQAMQRNERVGSVSSVAVAVASP